MMDSICLVSKKKLAVELPIKFQFFTICYGSKSLYFWEQKNETFAHISLRIRVVTRASVSHLIVSSDLGELIVQADIRRRRRRRPSVFSNDISFEAMKPILAIFNI